MIHACEPRLALEWGEEQEGQVSVGLADTNCIGEYRRNGAYSVYNMPAC